jgi:hypothetical protein
MSGILQPVFIILSGSFSSSFVLHLTSIFCTSCADIGTYYSRRLVNFGTPHPLQPKEPCSFNAPRRGELA